MKKLIALIASILICLFCLLNTRPSLAFEELDRILNYEITVTPLDDATLNMQYHIEWKVLDSTSEGPLSFVQIGVPNRFVDSVKSNSNAVKEAYYESDDGAYIHCELDRDYYKGEIVNIDFSFHQSRIFTNNSDRIEFGFKPGWFNEIMVERLAVYWDATKDISYTNATKSNEKYLIWETSLSYGETIECQAVYDLSCFPNIDLSKDYSSQTDNPIIVIAIVASIAVFIIAIVILIHFINKASIDEYECYRGFTGDVYYHHYWFYHHYGYYGRPGYDRKGNKINPPIIKNISNGGGTNVGGGGCACACACACAGGGRAGCSRKDFYNPRLKIEDLEDVLKKEDA